MAIGIVARSFGTHSGSFHADEVTACALLLFFELIDRDKIVRTRDLRQLDCCDFVCDVGGEFDPARRRFDHHQGQYVGEKSSAGMVLDYLKDEGIVSNKLCEYLNRVLIYGIDQVDTGKWEPRYGECTFSQVISAFVCPSYESSDVEFYEAFEEALDFVLGHLKRTVRKFEYIEKCSEDVVRVMEQMDECLIFERPMPWLEAFFENGGDSHKAEFVIMPAGGQWKLRGIPPSYDKRMDVRRPLPLEWAGLLGEELQKKSKIEGAVFCHKGRFISIWKTKADALKALKHVLEKR